MLGEWEVVLEGQGDVKRVREGVRKSGMRCQENGRCWIAYFLTTLQKREGELCMYVGGEGVEKGERMWGEEC